MKKLLVIAPHFPPTNNADMHRIRMSLPFYQEYGWEPYVLCFDPNSCENGTDERLLDSLPAGLQVTRIRCMSKKWTRPIGLSSIGFRGWVTMRSEIPKVVHHFRPDLAFFSTTAFPLMRLGILLKTKLQTPYVLDFQDPWVAEEGSILQPTLKNRTIRQLHRMLEPATLKNCSALMSVSPDYLDVLGRRYSFVQDIPRDVIPFGFSSLDQLIAKKLNNEEWQELPERLRNDLGSKTVGIYAGAFVNSMIPLISVLFEHIRHLLDTRPNLTEKLRLWFVGSNYLNDITDRPIAKLAKEYGLESIVHEHIRRVPYYVAIRLMQESSFNLLFGSMSRGYNPSKLFSALASERPLLAVTLENTTLDRLLRQTGVESVIRIRETDSRVMLFPNLEGFLACEGTAKSKADESVMWRYSARALTEQQSKLFDQAYERSNH